MRTKKTYIVLSFRTTVKPWPGRSTAPRHRSPAADPAPTGDLRRVRLAWRMTREDWEHWNSLLDPAAYDAVSQVEQ